MINMILMGPRGCSPATNGQSSQAHSLSVPVHVNVVIFDDVISNPATLYRINSTVTVGLFEYLGGRRNAYYKGINTKGIDRWLLKKLLDAVTLHNKARDLHACNHCKVALYQWMSSHSQSQNNPL